MIINSTILGMSIRKIRREIRLSLLLLTTIYLESGIRQAFPDQRNEFPAYVRYPQCIFCNTLTKFFNIRGGGGGGGGVGGWGWGVGGWGGGGWVGHVPNITLAAESGTPHPLIPPLDTYHLYFTWHVFASG